MIMAILALVFMFFVHNAQTHFDFFPVDNSGCYGVLQSEDIICFDGGAPIVCPQTECPLCECPLPTTTTWLPLTTTKFLSPKTTSLLLPKCPSCPKNECPDKCPSPSNHEKICPVRQCPEIPSNCSVPDIPPFAPVCQCPDTSNCSVPDIPQITPVCQCPDISSNCSVPDIPPIAPVCQCPVISSNCSLPDIPSDTSMQQQPAFLVSVGLNLILCIVSACLFATLIKLKRQIAREITRQRMNEIELGLRNNVGRDAFEVDEQQEENNEEQEEEGNEEQQEEHQKEGNAEGQMDGKKRGKFVEIDLGALPSTSIMQGAVVTERGAISTYWRKKQAETVYFDANSTNSMTDSF